MKKIFAIVLPFFFMTNIASFAAPIEILHPQEGRERTEFVHPGILHTESDFERVREKVAEKEEPWYGAYQKLASNDLARAGRGARAVSVVSRGSSGDNIALLYRDAAAAYQCALMWRITGSAEHGDTARDILNAWSNSLTEVTGNADRYLASGLYGYQLANAAELMRDYPGFELERMQNMLINVFYKPLCERFLISNEYGSDHNDAHVENYWANWDLANMAATVAIGIFCDREDIYNVGLEYFKNGEGNGSVYHAIPYVFEEEGLAQWQESGRDQAHTQLGIGLMGEICEMFYNQGDDLYSWANSRYYKAAEYVARYNNGGEVPFALYRHYSGQNGKLVDSAVVSDASRGEVRNMWDLVLNHYSGRRGLLSENIAARAEMQRPDGGPDYNSHASAFDLCGFTTLMFTGDTGGEASEPDGNIADGVYNIKNFNSSLYMDEGADSAVQEEKSGENSQRWIITHLGGGQYSIINAESRLALTIENASFENADRAVLTEFSGSENQRFAFLPTGEGYTIVASHSGKPIGAAGRSTESGAAVRQWKYEYSPHQKWYLELVREGANIKGAAYDKSVFEYGGKIYLKKGEEYTVTLKSDFDLSEDSFTILAESDTVKTLFAYDEDTKRKYEFNFAVYTDTAEILDDIIVNYDKNSYYTRESSEEFIPLYNTALSRDCADEAFADAAQRLAVLDKALVRAEGAEIAHKDGCTEVYSSKEMKVTFVRAFYDGDTLLGAELLADSISSGETLRIESGEGEVYLWDEFFRPLEG